MRPATQLAMRYGKWLVLALPFALAGCGYNTIQTLDEQTNSARSQIEVQLQRRADLIPNLVSTVKGYAAHEEQVFSEVAQARAGLLGAVQSHDPQQMADAKAAATTALGRLLAISEAYPQLKADQGFLKLQDELTGTENRLAVARGEDSQAAPAGLQHVHQNLPDCAHREGDRREGEGVLRGHERRQP